MFCSFFEMLPEEHIPGKLFINHISLWVLILFFPFWETLRLCLIEARMLFIFLVDLTLTDKLIGPILQSRIEILSENYCILYLINVCFESVRGHVKFLSKKLKNSCVAYQLKLPFDHFGFLLFRIDHA